MGRVTCQLSLSLDGFGAAPGQGPDHPLGVGGERLHRWAFGPPPPDPADAAIARDLLSRDGAYVMGRRMFGGGEGPWDRSWRGWWGEDTPFPGPVFVLTHHPREPLVTGGGTTFTFVTGGIHEALGAAREAAGDRDVAVAGGMSTARQFLRANLLDEVFLHLVPVLLGRGERLFEGRFDARLEPVEVIPSPAATHIRLRVRRDGDRPDRA
jgi:dihydrofolate reductase